jgi:hypothetical protein
MEQVPDVYHRARGSDALLVCLDEVCKQLAAREAITAADVRRLDARRLTLSARPDGRCSSPGSGSLREVDPDYLFVVADKD